MSETLKPFDKAKPLLRDPITGRFTSNKTIVPQVPTGSPQYNPRTTTNNVSELNKFAEKAISKVKKQQKISPKTRKSIERTIANIVNIAATTQGAEAFLNKTDKKPIGDQETKELFDQIDIVDTKHSSSDKSATKNVAHNSEVVKDKTEENTLLHEIAKHTEETAMAVKETKINKEKEISNEKKEERIKKASFARRGKDKTKEDKGFFENISHNVKTSSGGKFVKSVSGIGKGIIGEGGGAALGRAAVVAAPYVLTAGVIAMLIKGIYDRSKENKKAEKTGIAPETAGPDNVPESEEPESDKITNTIKTVEGENGDSKPGERFRTLSKEDRAKAFEKGGVSAAEVKQYERKHELLDQKEKEQHEYEEKMGISKIGPNLQNRGPQYDRGRRGYDASGSSRPPISPPISKTNSSGSLPTGYSEPTTNKTSPESTNTNKASSGGLMQQNIQDTNISTEGKALLDTIATHESGGDYNIRQGGSHVSDLSQFPAGMGKGGISSASGKYQFVRGTWEEASKALGLKDFSPESQDKAAWWLAQRDYHKNTGGSLAEDVKSKDPSKQLAIANALHKTWTSLPGGYDPGLGKAGRNGNEYLTTLNSNTKKYDSLPTKNDTGTKLASATTQNAQMADKLADAPQAPTVVNSPTNAVSHSGTQTASMPSVRNDDPVLLRAMTGDLKTA